MASDSDTLNIGSLRQGHTHRVRPEQTNPHRPVDPVINPAAAAAARSKIAAMPANRVLPNPGNVPAAPTVDLVTDRQALAKKTTSAHLTSGRRRLPSAVQPVLTAIGVFALVLLLFKAPIILSQLGYSFGNKSTPTAAAPADTVPAANTISIPKINVNAPVVYEPSVQEASVQQALQNGVVHYGNTPNPGQAGNVAIFGHSSNDWWEPGNYKFVFVLLDKLAPGDQITVDFQQHRYVYEVTGSRVVEPTDVGVLNPTATPTLTLITCTPPGTSLRRLVVTAKQVTPDPSKVAATATTGDQTSSSASGNLPSSAPDFFTQVKEAWNGVVHGFQSLFGSDGGSGSPSPSQSPGASGTSPNQLPAIK